MQSVPDFQQHPFSILPPLMIPKPQLEDPFICQKGCAFLIVLELFRHAMLKTIQLNRKPREWTIKIEKVFPLRMLASKFEASETSRLQRAPQFPFFLGLIAAETAGDGSRVHSTGFVWAPIDNLASSSSPRPSPPLWAEEREKMR